MKFISVLEITDNFQKEAVLLFQYFHVVLVHHILNLTSISNRSNSISIKYSFIQCSEHNEYHFMLSYLKLLNTRPIIYLFDICDILYVMPNIVRVY